jgi:tetratricopeptide (TPR) repeat protein
MREIPDKYKTLAIYAALILVPLAVFWQLRLCDFIIYDDPLYVAKNSHVVSGFTWENIAWAFSYNYASNWHPLTWLSHMLDCRLFDLKPSYHHLTNLLLHIAAVLLLFAALKRMTGAIWPSAFTAALFALHPLHVQSVAWIAERKDVLSTCFWMLIMICYVRYVRRQSAAGFLLTLLVFALGLMAKPMLVTLPFVLLLLDYWPLDRIGHISLTQPSYRRTILRLVCEKIPFFILSVVSSALTFLAQQKLAVIQVHKLPLATRVANAVVSYLEYIEKMFWPSRLAIFYPYSTDRLSMWRTAVAVLLLVGITILVIRLASKYRYLPVGWFWYLGTLVPVIGLVHVGLQARADRYTYVPLMGLFIIIAWGTPDLLKNWRHRRIILAVSAAAVLSALSVCTWRQTGYWRNSKTLFENAIKTDDDNYMAYTLLAYSYHEQGKFEQALAYDSKALQIKPDYSLAYADIGYILFKMGKLDEALAQFKQALQFDPGLFDVYQNIGKILSLQGRLDEATECLRKAVSLEPTDPTLHSELGVLLGRQGKFDEAVTQFNEALRIKPDFSDAHSNLGYVFLHQDKFDQAVTHLDRAVQLDPNSGKSQYYLAIALGEKGKFIEAVTHYDEALRLEPNSVDPLNSLAWLQATHNQTQIYNPQRAVQLAKKACELTGYKNATLLDTLAAAYAAEGSFTEAVNYSEKGLELAKSSGNSQLAAQIQKRLDLYKIGQPYVEPARE